jgi:hypothetical protein
LRPGDQSHVDGHLHDPKLLYDDGDAKSFGAHRSDCGAKLRGSADPAALVSPMLHLEANTL